MTRLRSRYPPWALARPSPAQEPEASAVRLEAEEDWGGERWATAKELNTKSWFDGKTKGCRDSDGSCNYSQESEPQQQGSGEGLAAWAAHCTANDAATVTEIPRGKYIGRRLGDAPKDETEHFIRCPACGGWMDCVTSAKCSSTKGHCRIRRRIKRNDRSAVRDFN